MEVIGRRKVILFKGTNKCLSYRVGWFTLYNILVYST